MSLGTDCSVSEVDSIGCLAYLAHVRDVIAETPTVVLVHMVCQFLDIFPTNLARLPPEKDVDFAIKVEPGTKPISILHTRWLLKELSTRLQSLVDLGFNWSSVSP